MKKVFAVIAAAGEGKRFGGEKQFVEIKGRKILEYCLTAFQENRDVDALVLVLKETAGADFYQSRFPKIRAVTEGGEKRQDSVFSGLKCIPSEKDGIVLVHDGVRPLVSDDLISRVVDAARTYGAAVPVVPLVETVKRVQKGFAVETLDRNTLRGVQTPQGFRLGILKEAFEKARRDSFFGTDEASLVERLGFRVAAVPGEARNIKITTPLDKKIAEVFFAV